MKLNRDANLISHIKSHYSELLSEVKSINDSYEEFERNLVVKKAINFDLLQIGENFSHLSDELKSTINMSDIRGIIDIRNFIAHGYVVLNSKYIWDCIHQDLPRLISYLG